MNKNIRWLIAVLVAVMLCAGATVAMATHSAGTNGAPATIQLLDASGLAVSGTTPYSPKMTCGGCHNYGSNPATVSKVQGYGLSTGKVAFDTYNVTTFTHGVSVGKHSSQGRSEEWTAALRTVWGAPASTSSPGMWGRY